MRPDQVQFLQKRKQQITEGCSQCAGMGYLESEPGEVSQCPSCSETVNWETRLVSSGIPFAYWGEIDNRAKGPRLQMYLEGLKASRQNGVGAYFYGGREEERLWSLAEVLKHAQGDGFNVHFEMLQSLVDRFFQSFKEYGGGMEKEVHRLVNDVDFLAIGEIDQVYHSQGSTLPEVLFAGVFRQRIFQKRPVLVTCSSLPEWLTEDRDVNTVRRLQELLKSHVLSIQVRSWTSPEEIETNLLKLIQ